MAMVWLRGYTDEELTNNSFIELQGIGRVYRTGDLAKVLTDGNIEFIGRKISDKDVRLQNRTWRDRVCFR